jgi:hypothetical protein
MTGDLLVTSEIWAFFQKPTPRKGGFLEGGFHVSGAFRKTIAEGRRFRKPGLREGGLADPWLNLGKCLLPVYYLSHLSGNQNHNLWRV